MLCSPGHTTTPVFGWIGGFTLSRPELNQQTFLSHLFAPKKNPKPTGIRKTRLTGTRGGRKKGRLAAFNRMSPLNQELLKQSGQREAYLRGDVSLTNARQQLRATAVTLGIARPPRIPQPPPALFVGTRRQHVEALVARHLKRTYAGAGKKYNARKIDERVPSIPDYVIDYVESWDYPELRQAASPGSPFEVIEGNARYNPFWYN